ncbi:pyruvate dehydrogenase E2 component (dihydrolipoamide acetyltransferase) [Mycobacterium frederiksbergense]|uniref:Dihydrolipoamide acetyltransferase component of pyruvate dehydrogenase complex n=1 Tax=Mycolicibacterium frederiksbergense TaxID=117567 RepID=A0ABT6L6Q4_9MYCO|nr:dihydrolipoamide acetyltransferase family protein [Mycolicibacterium frederiksbergense]MDH6198641.1 pyruvate dehydrogenase E2 component (dihydrolipoamide acetyltransferase) [Mycolicibacterium frederiksbergense]
MPEITMPRLSDTMEEGVIIAWHKKIGDRVERGEILAEIETDKAIMELESYDEGILEQMLAGEGDRVAIGVPIAIVGDGSGTIVATATTPDSATAPAPAAPLPAPVAAVQPQAKRPKASPLARKIAEANGVDLASVNGSGPGGRIIRKDVEAAPTAAPAAVATQPAPVPAEPRTGDFDEVPLTTLQRVAAKRLTESKQNAPHFYLTAAVDVTDLLAFRKTVNDSLHCADGPKVSVNDFMVRAVASALRGNPGVNVSFGGDALLHHHGVHIGVAVAVEAGLVVPVIRDADRKSVSQIAIETKEKAERARIGKLRADEMTGGTFTISNLGMYGIEQFAAVINPPEAAILAVGAAADELRLIDGEVVARKILRLTLSADHRAIDGSTGAVFLRDLAQLLENPLRIVA